MPLNKIVLNLIEYNLTTMKAQTHSSNVASLELDKQLCFALYSASLAMSKLYKPLLDPLSLTYPQYVVMLALWESDDVSVSALGDRVGLDSGTLTPLLKRLESAGFLRRERDAEDERRLRVRLTAPGRALRVKARAVPECLLKASGLQLAEVRGLTEQLQTLRQRISS